MVKNRYIKIYNGYGHTHNLHVYGHVFKKEPLAPAKFTNNILLNTIFLLRLFFVKPLPGVRLVLNEGRQTIGSTTGDDGFFKFEWIASDHIKAGWHSVQVSTDANDREKITGTGKVFIPHITQYGFISDIDDTIMISHSSTFGKRLKELFTKNPKTRSIFNGVAQHYKLLSTAHTTPDIPNPFFYVSSSEWNLYEYLANFFSHHELPEGVFLLNQVKRWFQLWKTGKTKHEGKLLRIIRVLNTFPNQKFVLLGDNSQSDPAIYTSLASRFPKQIFAIYIRNINTGKEKATGHLLNSLFKDGVHTCFFKESEEAIQHSRSIGLIG